MHFTSPVHASSLFALPLLVSCKTTKMRAGNQHALYDPGTCLFALPLVVSCKATKLRAGNQHALYVPSTCLLPSMQILFEAFKHDEVFGCAETACTS